MSKCRWCGYPHSAGAAFYGPPQSPVCGACWDEEYDVEYLAVPATSDERVVAVVAILAVAAVAAAYALRPYM